MNLEGLLKLQGIALGYAYFLVFNIAFSNCDKVKLQGNSIIDF
jgi:hypothetical protein